MRKYNPHGLCWSLSRRLVYELPRVRAVARLQGVPLARCPLWPFALIQSSLYAQVSDSALPLPGSKSPLNK